MLSTAVTRKIATALSSAAIAGTLGAAAASAMPVDPLRAPGEPGDAQIVAPTPSSIPEQSSGRRSAAPDDGFDLSSAAIGAAAGTGLLIVVLAAGAMAWRRPITRRHRARLTRLLQYPAAARARRLPDHRRTRRAPPPRNAARMGGDGNHGPSRSRPARPGTMVDGEGTVARDELRASESIAWRLLLPWEASRRWLLADACARARRERHTRAGPRLLQGGAR